MPTAAFMLRLYSLLIDSLRICSLLLWGFMFCIPVGCERAPRPVRSDTSGAEMSTQDDYVAYDREMAELASGQK